MISRYGSIAFTGSHPNKVPDGAGDAFYEQDRIRDFAFLLDSLGLVAQDVVGSGAKLISGGKVTLNGLSRIDFTAGVGYVPWDVPLGYDGSTPPLTADETIENKRVTWPDVTSFGPVSGTATYYMKIGYGESNAVSRTRLKAGGTWYFMKEGGAYGVLDTVAPTAYEILLATLTVVSGNITSITPAMAARPSRGSTITIAAYNAPASWKVGANYVMSSGEDLCDLLTKLYAAGSNVLDVQLSPGAFTNTTPFAPASAGTVVIRGVRGRTFLTSTMSSSGTTGRTFDFTGLNVVSTLADINILYSNSSGGTFQVIMGNWNITGWNRRQLYSGISIDITSHGTGADVCWFYGCENISDCHTTLSATVGNSSNYTAYRQCASVHRCRALFLTEFTTSYSNTLIGFGECRDLSKCYVYWEGMESGVGSSGYIRLFSDSNDLYDCYAETGIMEAGTISLFSAFAGCYRMVLCKTTFRSGASTVSYPFYMCIDLDSCRADVTYGCDATYYSCNRLVNCYAGLGLPANGSRRGFDTCTFMSGCSASGHIVGMYNCQHITVSTAFSNTTYGFQGCKQCQQNYVYANTTANYNTSFADQATNACANTAAGGYNR